MKHTSLMLLVPSLAAGLFLAEAAAARPGGLHWKHLSTVEGDLAPPGHSTQQTASLVLDVDGDRINDFVIGARRKAPSLVWYRRTRQGWTRYLMDADLLPLEAGGACHDIDGDGDLDVAMGEDSTGNKVYWWENPRPDYRADRPWTRRVIKHDGANKHHDQIFGDFDGDGAAELVFWNQGAQRLCLAEVPADVHSAPAWPYRPIFRCASKCEGLAKADVDGDGIVDVVGGGRWFRHRSAPGGATVFEPQVIDDRQCFTRAAAGQLIKGGRAEVVFGPGDTVGPLKWYAWSGEKWVGHRLLQTNVDHGHSLRVADVDGDGNLDVFCAEMRLNGKNPRATMWIFLGDGKGNFTTTRVAEGFGNHESRVADLDGDGDLDILGKPYNWETPRLDIWLNEP